MAEAHLHLGRPAQCVFAGRNHSFIGYMVEPWVRDAIIGRPVVKDSYFELPDEPGLRVDQDEKIVAGHPLWAPL
jgi:L-alanine-DL-glutamate epimerase-like enolase superfamily enzyme